MNDIQAVLPYTMCPKQCYLEVVKGMAQFLAEIRCSKNNRTSIVCLFLGVKTTCQRERTMSHLQPVVSMKLPQLLRPMRPWSSLGVRCDANGGYNPVQCQRGTPFCWCVDKYGREVPRTRISGKPKCGPMGN